MNDENNELKDDQNDNLIENPLLNPFNNDRTPTIQLMDEIELERISNSSSSSSPLDLEENSNIRVVGPDRDRTLCYSNLFFFLTTIGAVLWALSEGGLYGHGLIRGKLFNETCSHWHGRNCVEGLRCIGGFCTDRVEEKNQTIVVLNNTCEVCLPPVQCPPRIIKKVVSYFDFNEFPAHYLRQEENDPDLKLIKDISYDACKELCGGSPSCTAVSYHGGAHECHLRQRKDYTINDLMRPVGGDKFVGFWIAAFKT